MRNWNIAAIAEKTDNFTSFYSTYEELKRIPCFINSSSLFLFLQYLWGIETTAEVLGWAVAGGFLQYLWGIETSSVCSIQPYVFFCFYSTYEELKHKHLFFNIAQHLQFLQYLWGIETNIVNKQYFIF